MSEERFTAIYSCNSRQSFTAFKKYLVDQVPESSVVRHYIEPKELRAWIVEVNIPLEMGTRLQHVLDGIEFAFDNMDIW